MDTTGTTVRKYVAEGIGTAVLVFGGVGSAVLAGDQIGYLGVALAFGLSLLAMAYAIGPVSGCHVNPAVTAGMLLSRKIRGRDAAWYVVSQIVGAIVATALIAVIAKGRAGGYDIGAEGLGANGFADHSTNGFNLGACLVAEATLTFLLVLTVLGSTDIKAPVGFAGIPIGLVLVVDHLIGIPITGTSVNPARSIGPALFVGGWAIEQLWLFIVAPIIGAVLASAAYTVLKAKDVPTIDVAEAEQALGSEQRQRSTTPID